MSSNETLLAAVTYPVVVPADPESLRLNAARVAAVRDTQLLDTAPEEVFDRLTALTARLLDVPIAFLALIDSDRDYHKSRHVFGKAQQADLILRGRTFCHYTMVSPTPIVINDATQYPLYRDIATVREQGVRAFAGVPLTSRDGQRIGTFCAVDFQPKDWTERDLEVLTELAQAALREISMRQALRSSEENAQAARSAVRAREEVLAIVAHDLRDPLEVIRHSTESLAKRPRPSEESETMQRMQHAANTMDDLVTDLLEVSKIRQGRSTARQSRIPANELLEDAMQMMQPTAARGGILITNEAPPGPRDVIVDYERILRVLANLIGNAIKFSAKGSTIALHAEHGLDSVKLSVTDDGAGIDPHERTHIFDRFWQSTSHTATSQRSDVGLILASAREIIEAQGGQIGVEESADPGSSFYIVLPTA